MAALLIRQQGIIRVGGYGPYSLSGNIGGNYHAFAPRFGLAYSMNEKTVVRMGFGVSYDIGVFGSNFGHAVTQNLPVLANQTNTASTTIPGASDNYIAAYNLAQLPTYTHASSNPPDGRIAARWAPGQRAAQNASYESGTECNRRVERCDPTSDD